MLVGSRHEFQNMLWNRMAPTSFSHLHIRPPSRNHTCEFPHTWLKQQWPLRKLLRVPDLNINTFYTYVMIKKPEFIVI